MRPNDQDSADEKLRVHTSKKKTVLFSIYIICRDFPVHLAHVICIDMSGVPCCLHVPYSRLQCSFSISGTFLEENCSLTVSEF